MNKGGSVLGIAGLALGVSVIGWAHVSMGGDLRMFAQAEAMAVVFGSAVRGAGDTRFSLIFSLLAACLVLVLPVWLAWRWQTITLTFSWWIVSGYIILLGFGYVIRFQQGRWKQMSVIEHEILDEVDEHSGDCAEPSDDIDRDPDPQPQLVAV